MAGAPGHIFSLLCGNSFLAELDLAWLGASKKAGWMEMDLLGFTGEEGKTEERGVWSGSIYSGNGKHRKQSRGEALCRRRK